MLTIQTVMTTSGSSKAVRLPKIALEQSRLERELELVVREGEIIIRNRRARDGWRGKISALIENYGDPTDEFIDHRTTDDFSESWKGVSYTAWKKGSSSKPVKK